MSVQPFAWTDAQDSTSFYHGINPRDIVELANGNFAVLSYEAEVRPNPIGLLQPVGQLVVRLHDASGNPLGDPVHIAPDDVWFDQADFGIAAGPDGGFAIHYMKFTEFVDLTVLASQYQSQKAPMLQLFNDTGVPMGAAIETASNVRVFDPATATYSTLNQPSQLQVVTSPLGHYMAVWRGDEDLDGFDETYVQRYSAEGAVIDASPIDVTSAAGIGSNVHIEFLSSGGFMVVGSNGSPTAFNENIRAQQFDASGAAVGAAFDVEQTAIFDQVTSQEAVEMAVLDNGTFVTLWEAVSQGSPENSYALAMRVMDPNGTGVTGEIILQSGTVDAFDVKALKGGDFAVTYTAGGSAFMQLFDSAGGAIGSAVNLTNTLAGAPVDIVMQVLSNGRLAFSYNSDVYTGEVQVFSTESGNLVGTNAGNFLVSAGTDAAISGMGGNDTINLGSGDHLVDAGDGYDYITTGGDNDTIVDNDLLADTVDGGTGIDTWVSEAIKYDAGDKVDLTAGRVYYGGLALDTLSNIENLRVAGEITLTGNALNNELVASDAQGAFDNGLFGEGGNDTLVGSGGADTLNGGSGSDEASYSMSDAAVTVDLSKHNSSASAASGGHAQGDVLIDIEHLTGSRFDDQLYGTSGGNVFHGLHGDDFINTFAGADTVFGGTGDDTVQDTETSVQANTDTYLGGDGVDTLIYDSFYFYGTVFDLSVGRQIVYGVNRDTFLGFENVVAAGGAYVIGNDADNKLTASDKQGTASNTLEGGVGDDTLNGAGGADTLRGGADDDVLIGGVGADQLEGGSGFDAASYETSAAGLTVDLDTPAANTGDAAGDSFASIENLIGSDYDDTLYGAAMAKDNVIWGGRGNDTIDARTGQDTVYGGRGDDVIIDGDITLATNVDHYDGGEGFDEVRYVTTAWLSTDVFDLGAGLQTRNGFQYDTFANVEGLRVTGDAVLIGSSSDDRLVASDALGAGDNLLQGLGGHDLLLGGAGSDTLDGGEGDDVLDGGAGDDTLFAGAGADTLIGGTGADEFNTQGSNGKWISYETDTSGIAAQLAYPSGALTLSGGDAQGDTVVGSYFGGVRGGTGADTITARHVEGGAGADTLTGGDQVQGSTLYYTHSAAGITLDFGTDAHTGGDAQGDVLSGFETVVATAYNDTILLGDLSDQSGTAPSTIYGGDGDDLIDAFDAQGISFFGQAGDDTLRGSSSLIWGDTLSGGAGDDLIKGYEGNDALRGGSGQDTLDGGNGIDFLDGGAGDDELFGGKGGDRMFGGSGSDLIQANGGDDSLYAQGGMDTLIGGKGDDYINAADWRELVGSGAVVHETESALINGGDGLDTLSYAKYWSTGVTINLGTGETGGDAQGDSISNIEILVGSGFADDLTGNDDDNFILGAYGPDTIRGGKGADILMGQYDGLLRARDNTELDGLKFREKDVRAILGIGQEMAGTARSFEVAQLELHGGRGWDWLYAGQANAHLFGGKGNDTLYYRSYADTFYTYAGGTYAGGDGVDTFVLDFSGRSIVNSYYGADGFVANFGSATFSGIEVFRFSTPVTTQENAVFDTYYATFTAAAVEQATTIEGWGLLNGDGEQRFNLELAIEGSSSDLSHLTFKDWELAQDTVRLVGTFAAGTHVAANVGGIIEAMGGNDTLIGSNTRDTLHGGDQDDEIHDGRGRDQVFGGQGNDIIHVGGGIDQFDGGDGEDTISYRDSLDGVQIDLEANTAAGGMAGDDTIVNFESAIGSGSGDDTLHGTAGANTLAGYGGADFLSGRGSDDLLEGHKGADTLRGGAGEDTLYGARGSDMLDGGNGDDVLHGGLGTDEFHFDRADGADTIKDFQDDIDTLALDDFGYLASVGDALSYAAEQSGHVLFDFGAQGSVLVENITLAQMGDDILLL